MEKHNNAVSVNSEIGRLKTVLLHKPGKEIENLTPDLLERLLFDDIPFLKIARQEHAAFVDALEQNGVETLFIEELLSEVLENDETLKLEFIEKFIKEAKVNPDHIKKLRDYFFSLTTKEMIDTMIGGLETRELGVKNPDKYPFVIDPLPNILFQRDPFATMYNGVSLFKMKFDTRNRETLFSDYVLKHHHRFKGVHFYYQRDDQHYIEGGDVMVLNENTLVIGCSQRTSMKAIELLTKRIIIDNNNPNFKVIALDIPKKRAFMHLDTVMTSIDYDKFIVHPLIFDYLDQFGIYEIDKNGKRKIDQSLVECLSKATGKKIEFIRCGGNSPIAAAREQWNDGTNVLTIRPGVIISYSRNHVTNKLLREAGVKVIEIPSSELSRGRGGPRCMTMPIIRENI